MLGLVLIVVGTLGAARIIESKIPMYLQSAVAEKSKGMYQIRFRKIDLSLVKGRCIAENVHLIPDTGNQSKLKERNLTSLFEIRVKKIEMSGLRLLKLLWNEEVHLSKIRVNQPLITRFNFLYTATEKKSIRQQLQAINKRICIDEIMIAGIQYRSVNMYTKRSTWLGNLNFYARKVAFGVSVKQQPHEAFQLAEELRLFGRKITCITNNGLYRLQLAGLDISTKTNRINIDSLYVIPKYTQVQWSRQLKYKRDRYNMFFPQIKAVGVDFYKWLAHGRLRADSLIVNQAVLHVYADKGMMEKTTIATNNFPSLAFQRLTVPLTIKSVFIGNTDIYYKERNPKSGRAGLVFFRGLNGHLLNVSNDRQQLKQDPWIKGQFSTLFLGKPKLTLALDFNMKDTSGAFRYKGTLEGAPASFYNQLLEPISLARAERGYINKVQFNISANRYGAHVETQMTYNTLKVAVLSAESGKLEKKGFLSLFVNWLAIKGDNPPKKGGERIARHYYKHAQEKPFFNLMWKALYSGLKVNLGLPDI